MTWAISDFDRVDPKLYRAFLAAIEAESFSEAAEKINMTQSGVSQHIAKLEDQIGVDLFMRCGTKVKLTPAGEELKVYIQTYMETVTQFLDRVNASQEQMRGQVSYAMPASCILSNHFSLLLQKRKHFPDIELRVLLESSPLVVQDVMEGKFDFGFTTKKIPHRLLVYEPFCQEEYVLVAGEKFRKPFSTLNQLMEEPFVIYSGFEVYFDLWVKHAFKVKETPNVLSLHKAGEMNDILGAVQW